MKKAKIVITMPVSDMWSCKIYMRRLFFFWFYVNRFTVWRIYAKTHADLVRLLEKQLTQRGFDKTQFIIEFKKVTL